MSTTDLTFRSFGTLNKLRAMEWHKGGLDTWSPAEWTNALAGEVGELCNITKKLLRHDLGIQQRAVDNSVGYPADLGANGPRELTNVRIELLDMAADELGDCQAYLDLCAQRLGIDLQTATVRKFNYISDRERLPFLFESRFLLPSELGEELQPEPPPPPGNRDVTGKGL